MNFNQFLQKKNVLAEAYTKTDAEPAVVGFVTCEPCHVGYLSLVAELVKLGEQHDVDPTLVILEHAQDDGAKRFDDLAAVLSILEANYPTLRVKVADSIHTPIYEMSNFGMIPVAIVGENVHVRMAALVMKELYHKPAEYKVLNLSEYKQSCIRAVKANSFNNFRAAILECSFDLADRMFEQLKEVYNG